MSYFYFFKNDGKCKWMINEIEKYYPKYLRDPIDFKGKKVKFYTILKWVFRNNKGANLKWAEESGLNYVNTIDELPEGAGIYTTGYDADLVELEEARKKGIPIIEHPCPWVREIRRQLQEMNTDTHQCIFMVDRDHMIYECYHTIFPEDIIIIQNNNYKEEIRKHKNKKPIHLIIYSVFRKKEVKRVINFIRTDYPHPDNKLDGYKKTLCMWIRQGLLEEIEEAVKEKKLDEVWVVCSSERDRSTTSIISEIRETGAKPIVIKKLEDIPEKIDDNLRVGVLLAPIPLSKGIGNIINIIKEEYVMVKV
ncbi:MAG: hypothetical protein KAT05_11075 [Spirochaetes bacterium]|nr:hypothetical protein [Spirochaetota bacterium]